MASTSAVIDQDTALTLVLSRVVEVIFSQRRDYLRAYRLVLRGKRISNETLSDGLGYVEGVLINAPWRDLLHPSDVSPAQDGIRSASPWILSRFRKGDESYAWFYWQLLNQTDTLSVYSVYDLTSDSVFHPLLNQVKKTRAHYVTDAQCAVSSTRALTYANRGKPSAPRPSLSGGRHSGGGPEGYQQTVRSCRED